MTKKPRQRKSKRQLGPNTSGSNKRKKQTPKTTVFKSNSGSQKSNPRSTSSDSPSFRGSDGEKTTFSKHKGHSQKSNTRSTSFRGSDGEKIGFSKSKKFRSKAKKFANDKPAPIPEFNNILNPSLEELKQKGIRLNKYLSNSGVSSRRKADELIKAGLVTVNDEVVKEMGYRVSRKDVVRFEGKIVSPDKKVYILINKPKDTITTTTDPQGRRTVMDLIRLKDKTRLYPVGRLDRNTTGLLVITNDGELAQELSHPSREVRKLYHVFLNKAITKNDLKKIQQGITLEDGKIRADKVAHAGGRKNEVGIEIHSGRNRIVRRIFEHLGYEVVKLDRVMFSNLTKKDLPRGKWRFIEEHELIYLKHLNNPSKMPNDLSENQKTQIGDDIN